MNKLMCSWVTSADLFVTGPCGCNGIKCKRRLSHLNLTKQTAGVTELTFWGEKIFGFKIEKSLSEPPHKPKLHQTYTNTASSKTTWGVLLQSDTPETYLQSHEGLQIVRGLGPKGTRVKKQSHEEVSTLLAPCSVRNSFHTCTSIQTFSRHYPEGDVSHVRK